MLLGVLEDVDKVPHRLGVLHLTQDVSHLSTRGTAGGGRREYRMKGGRREAVVVTSSSNNKTREDKADVAGEKGGDIIAVWFKKRRVRTPHSNSDSHLMLEERATALEDVPHGSHRIGSPLVPQGKQCRIPLSGQIRCGEYFRSSRDTKGIPRIHGCLNESYGEDRMPGTRLLSHLEHPLVFVQDGIPELL